VLCSAPVAAIAGPIKGTICGAKNGIHYSIDKPFSKDAFSLGKLEDESGISKARTQVNTDKPELQPWGTPR
jgi:hypothetical protein